MFIIHYFTLFILLLRQWINVRHYSKYLPFSQNALYAAMLQRYLVRFEVTCAIARHDQIPSIANKYIEMKQASLDLKLRLGFTLSI